MLKSVKLNSRFLKRRFNSENAFTVVEILTVIVVSAMLVTVLWRLFSNTFTNVKSGTEHVHVTRYFRLAMMYLKDDMDNSTSLEIFGNKGDSIQIKKIVNIDGHGNPGFSDVTYSNENGNIKREENGAKTLIGDNKQVEMNFSAKKICMNEADYSKYEVSILLSGKNLKNENEVDSVEVVVTPQMMIKNKAITWIPNPAVTTH